MSGPKPDALPLGDTPLHNFIYHSIGLWVGVKGLAEIKKLVLLKVYKDGAMGNLVPHDRVGISVTMHIAIDWIIGDQLLLWSRKIKQMI